MEGECVQAWQSALWIVFIGSLRQMLDARCSMLDALMV